MKLLLGFLAACIFAVAADRYARAADEPGAVVAELLRDLHYDGPPPAITLVNAHQVVEACNCRPPAFYRDSTAYLSLALDLNDVFDRSIVLHELVHHIQWVAGGEALDCNEWHRREVLAHAAQNAWLAEHGSRRRVLFTGVCR